MQKLSVQIEFDFVSGGQAGEYFGAAVVGGDFKGDGADDGLLSTALLEYCVS